MKKLNALLKRVAFLPLLLSVGMISINAQTITTTGSGYTGSTSSGSNSFITFVIENNSGSDVFLTTVGRRMTTSHNNTTATLYYSSTSLSGSPGSLTSPTWTQVASGTVTGITSTGIDTALSGMTFLIPNSTQYRFALHTTGTNYYSGSSASPNSFTTSGITLKVGNSQISGMNIGYGGSNNPRAFTGFVVLEPAGAPCSAPASVSVTNVSSTSASIGWPAVSGSQGYEYTLTTSATAPTSGWSTTTTNSYVASGLTPSTAYHFYVRNKCAPPYQAKSAWVHYAFNTNPPCTKRKIKIKNITINSADIEWDTVHHASGFEYVVSTSRSVSSGTITSTSSVYNATGLNEGTTYYVFVKMHCPGGESSEWAVDSFRTLFVCRPPILNVSNLSADRAIVYWDPRPTAIKYEYELSQSPTPLGHGTSILTNSFYAFPLKGGETYYFHVKSVCEDQGVNSISDWTSSSFRTFPTSVLDKTANQRSVIIFPNPVRDVITISAADATKEGLAVITDLSGKEVKHIKATERLTTVDISTLSPGTYIIRYSDDSISQIFKFTKL